jgi:curved DNA binding protein
MLTYLQTTRWPTPTRELALKAHTFSTGSLISITQTHQVQDRCSDLSEGPRDRFRFGNRSWTTSLAELTPITGWCTEGAKIVEICQKGDKLLDDEVAKVYKGKSITKGISHPCTISPSSYVTPYTPLVSDAEEAESKLKAGEAVKIQLGAQIDGFGTIVCDTVIVGGSPTGRTADLLLATHYANELLLRTMLPPGLLNAGTEEEKKKTQSVKPYSQSKITQLLEKVAKSYECTLVENTTCWLFERNEIEAKKKIILAPGEGVKGEGLPEVGEVWGVEVGLSTGTGKVKTLPNRPTLHRRTTTTYGLKRPSSRATLSEVKKKFGTFPFSLRQLDDERSGKVGVVECVRGGVIRQYEVVGSTDSEPVSRLFTTVAITKNGMTRLGGPPAFNPESVKSDKKITDEEVLKILETQLGKPASDKKKNKKKKKKPAKKPAAAPAAKAEESDDDDDDDEEDDSDDE